ncbi:hypothetical protein FNV43_RR22938 [Rhamnella rubrinervis]|uniref:Uncharacterized protein n=1 Tax=Rhamnella rubrinervis TaxID=2594499 RepID=A0A8K0DSF9_9ROSA|nr:hypothetical protein FNV43_RR22938 [Rhamnella rubrinervis]
MAERRTRIISIEMMQLKYGSYIEIVEYNTQIIFYIPRKACLTVMVDDVELSLGLARFRGAEMVVRGKILEQSKSRRTNKAHQQNTKVFLWQIRRWTLTLLFGSHHIAGAGLLVGIICNESKVLSLKLGHNLLIKVVIGFVFRIFRVASTV